MQIPTSTRLFFVAVQSLIHVRLSETPWTTARQASLAFTVSRSLLKLMSIELVMPSNHLILHLPLLLCPQSLPASGCYGFYDYLKNLSQVRFKDQEGQVLKSRWPTSLPGSPSPHHTLHSCFSHSDCDLQPPALGPEASTASS